MSSQAQDVSSRAQGMSSRAKRGISAGPARDMSSRARDLSSRAKRGISYGTARQRSPTAFVQRSMDRQYYVYIMTNRSGTLYIGVTSNLVARVHQHKTKCIEGFTKKYNLTQLVYYEAGTDVREAIAREKQLK